MDSVRIVNAAAVAATVAVPLPLLGIWGGIALDELLGWSWGAPGLWAAFGGAVVGGAIAIVLARVAVLRRPSGPNGRPVFWATAALVGGSFALAYAAFWIALALSLRGAF